MISPANRVVKIGCIYEDLENLHNLLQICVDSMKPHNVLDLDSTKHVLVMATEKAYTTFPEAKNLHNDMLAALQDGAK
ncbi:hypothetical protein [Thiothrix subterranea]|uniref:hypothetical protein n=1 Tax=Thiothrix subterranea TaxID=2735563 RepID=UPI00280B3472|nr:hypothetical protein [Thiothrix subterranea]